MLGGRDFDLVQVLTIFREALPRESAGPLLLLTREHPDRDTG